MPPTVPETFFTNYKVVYNYSNTTHTISGFIAQDDGNKLFTQNKTTSFGNTAHEIFNQRVYEIYNGSKSQCDCSNMTYKDDGLPFFHILKNLELYEQTETENIWKVPSDITLFLVSFKRVTPNIPEKILEIFEDLISNITFIGFQASQPDSKLFIVPDFCTKVPCHNLTKRAPMFFSKLMGN